MTTKPKLALAGVATVLVTTGFLVGMKGLLPRPEVELSWSIPLASNENYTPRPALPEGAGILFVYIGSLGCPFSNQPTVVKAVQGAMVELANRSDLLGICFTALGVGVDLSTDDGLRHLNMLGQFDEVSTGQGWYNAAVACYVYDVFPGPAATPQVLVAVRHVANESGDRLVTGERVILRKVGTGQIMSWAEGGAKLAGIEQLLDSLASAEQTSG